MLDFLLSVDIRFLFERLTRNFCHINCDEDGCRKPERAAATRTAVSDPNFSSNPPWKPLARVD